MENNNKIYAIVDWYDKKQGFGIAKNNEVPIFLHNSYLENKNVNLKPNDIISCSVSQNDKIYYATEIELVNELDKQSEQIHNQNIK